MTTCCNRRASSSTSTEVPMRSSGCDLAHMGWLLGDDRSGMLQFASADSERQSLLLEEWELHESSSTALTLSSASGGAPRAVTLEAESRFMMERWRVALTSMQRSHRMGGSLGRTPRWHAGTKEMRGPTVPGVESQEVMEDVQQSDGKWVKRWRRVRNLLGLQWRRSDSQPVDGGTELDALRFPLLRDALASGVTHFTPDDLVRFGIHAGDRSMHDGNGQASGSPLQPDSYIRVGDAYFSPQRAGERWTCGGGRATTAARRVRCGRASLHRRVQLRGIRYHSAAERH